MRGYISAGLAWALAAILVSSPFAAPPAKAQTQPSAASAPEPSPKPASPKAEGLKSEPIAKSPETPRRVVRIASEGARPPYNALDAKGELVGFEIDLARALCLRARFDCAFVSQEWDQMLAGLEAGSYDAVISAMEPTDERKRRARFGAPYARMPLALLIDKSDEPPKGMLAAALKGKSVGVEADTPQAYWAEEELKGAEIRPYASLEEAILDLASDRVDYVIALKDSASEFLAKRREGQCCRIARDIPRDPDYMGEGFAMAFRARDDDLRAAFDKALSEAIEDGAYARISEKYFSYPIL
jgi:polar amino acid transport system substrate-binding protein